jgi:hypothetical protein
MGSRREIVKSKNGVTLTKVSLMGANGPLSIGYAIASGRSPESWTAGNAAEAEKLFNEEVARCGGVSR